MRDDIYENIWSPFDPVWYQKAFDKPISTADQLLNQSSIIEQGYSIPDKDGSKSSIFRNDAILNNSFNESVLRDSLKEIYQNSTHKLVASNHDNVNFFQWTGHMSDMKYIPSTNICELRIPWNMFINAKERDSFKLSQFYRKWIKIEDILNNWNIFKWHIMLFINQKIYSEYEISIDDQEVVVRFQYNEYWVKQNYPIYIYKFDTNSQCRILVSRELCENQWNWKMPIDVIPDKRILNSSRVIVALNKISDSNIRKDGHTKIEVIGDNLEFFEIKDGYMDMSSISDFNRAYINSELREWLWMSIIVPKFFHEYPVLLPTDTIYRPYKADLRPVVTIQSELIQKVKTDLAYDEQRQIYVDLNNKILEEHNGWKQMIRPIVLSDAFEDPMKEPYDFLIDELRTLRDLTVLGANIIEDFRFFMKEEIVTEKKLNEFLDNITSSMNNIREAHNTFLDKRMIEWNKEYENLFHDIFLPAIEEIRNSGEESIWFNPERTSKETFWTMTSPLIIIPRELADKFYVIEVIKGMKRRHLWNNINDFMGSVRFQRPIEEQDFWTFEYDSNKDVWRPKPLVITRHFPDVYLAKDPLEDTPTPNRIFKAFFFYSDTMNILNKSREITRATPSWDEDIIEYYHEPRAIYRDIFMEKFYWMGIRAIYKGLLMTNCRWEVLEYIIDNDSYQRFNELFLHTMDPYFKLGLTTYLKSSNFEFPFDDAIDKLEESINLNWNGFKKNSNFEVYLNKNWIHSYFDYVIKIMDNWNYGNRLRRRPSSTFDMGRLQPIMIEIQTEIVNATKQVLENIKYVLENLKDEDYNLDVPGIQNLHSSILELLNNMEQALEFITKLDMDIYSIDDINYIITLLKKHGDIITKIGTLLYQIREDVDENNIYTTKRSLIRTIEDSIQALYLAIGDIMNRIQSFDMDEFMKAINDLDSYFDHAKTNPDDNSLIGQLNKFNDAWTAKVKEMRNLLFISTTTLYGNFQPSKTYSNEEVTDFILSTKKVQSDIDNIKSTIESFWINKGLEKDQIVIDRLDHVIHLISQFTIEGQEYYDNRNQLVTEIDRIKNFFNLFNETKMSEREKDFRNRIKQNLNLVLESISYIAGKNRKEEVETSLTTINEIIQSWLNFILKEEEIFDVLFDIVELPSPLLLMMEENQIILEPLIQYMATVNFPFIPDTGLPTYSDIYEVDTIEIDNSGFRHKVGDVIFVPRLGSYKIISITDKIAQVENIEDIGYRKTSFRDPTVQARPYDSISNGIGIGFTIKPISSIKTRIINDDVVSLVIIRIQNILKNISRFLQILNPHNNVEFNTILDTILEIKKDWNKTLNVFDKYMTEDIMLKMIDTIDYLISIIPVSKIFLENRDKIQPKEFAIKLEKLIHEIYKYIADIGQQDEEFFYHDNAIRVVYNDLLAFLGSGTSWQDGERLKTILSEIRLIIEVYERSVLSDLSSDEKLIELRNNINSIYSSIDSICLAIDDLPNYIPAVQSVLNNLLTMMADIPIVPHKDIWYRIKKVSPAMWGENYQLGDIIEIIPELPVDINGNVISDMEDIIMNDVILLQVMEVEEGRVTKLQPFMDYAIPYLIWGIRNTITRTGKGTGLTVDIFSTEVTLKDSTLLSTEDSYIPIPPVFEENDLFMFKFDNTHDLNINYELFLGGKQITNFFHRHEEIDDPLLPRKIDVIYINANEVMNLQNSSISIPAEHYFIYKINNITIKDPGAGYSIGQNIFIDAEQFPLKLKVGQLLPEPYKGIKEINMNDCQLIYNGKDPYGIDAEVVSDTLNNIDDEFHVSYYDKLGKEGIKKPATMSYSQEKYEFHSRRFDNLDGDNRNSKFMYPDVDIIDLEESLNNGDPDHHWYQGNRIDNSQHPMIDSRRWNSIINLNPPTDPFIPDAKRLPPGKTAKGEYQMFEQIRLHNSENIIYGDLEVETFSDLPRHTHDWPDGKMGKTVIVKCDETNDGHRMLYRIRTFVAAGFFVYNIPELADKKWNSINVNWMKSDWYPDYPGLKQQYPSAPWRKEKSFRLIQEGISDGRYQRENIPQIINNTSYIHQMTLDDISVFNWTTKEWENLHDETRWKLEVYDNPNEKDWGFILIFLEEGYYSYDMRFFWNKIPENQLRNADLKRNAVMDISTAIVGEVNTPAINMSVNTGRSLVIRKLFPYEQVKTFTIGYSSDGDPLGYEMDFKLAPYMHYKNEIHLEDIKIFNRTANRFEDILDRKMFEVRFKDPKATSRGYETQTKIVRSLIGKAGQGFVDGVVWGWNEEFGIHIFGTVTADFTNTGYMLTFTPTHCPNPPEENIALEFQVYQHASQTEIQMGVVMIEFQTERLEVYGDGYIHNVSNPLAPVPNEFKVIVQYNLDGPYEYDVIIDKTPQKWIFIEPEWMMIPTFHIPNYNIQQDRVYLMTDKGRFPLVNPSTGKPSLHVKETENGTEIMFLNLYRRYEHLEVRSVPYPMRSVYVQRKVPSHGYINLEGKINKPLNRKYFEFWMNGKLLNEEVTIISPTKIILHGLKSLRNFEIIEINRDSNEYFSDSFLEKRQTGLGRPFHFWNYETYLDAVLEGKLEKDNYTLEEQEYLLSPVWKQVNSDHPSFKDFPPNMDIEDDVILRVNPEDIPVIGLTDASYEFLMVDTPTLEGTAITGRGMKFSQFGWRPISDDMIVELLNEEWAEEIKNNPYFPGHVIISDEAWYGTTARLYDEYGILVHNLNEAAYKVADPNTLRIHANNKMSRIIKNTLIYNLD